MRWRIKVVGGSVFAGLFTIASGCIPHASEFEYPSDDAGVSKQVDAKDADSGGVGDVEDDTAEPDDTGCTAPGAFEICARLSAECGPVMVDACGTTVSASCGGCVAPEVCTDDNSCGCGPGYVADPNATCRDVDECVDGTHDCAGASVCANTDGAFVCECPNPDAYYDGSDCAPRRGGVIELETIAVVIPAGETTGVATLRRPVVMANSVPFATKYSSDVADLALDYQAEVWLEADDTIMAERNGIVGEITVWASVVEFNPALVAVQSGSFSLSGTETKVPVAAVDTSHALSTFYFRSSSVLDIKLHNDVASFFDAPDSLTFQRTGDDGDISGHWYIAEALDNAFSVQHVPPFDLAAGTGVGSVSINAVDPARSFAIYSHGSDTATDDAADSHLSCGVVDPLNFACARGGAVSNVTGIRAQVVSLNGSTQQVFRGVMTFPASVGVLQNAVPTTVPPRRSMAWGGYAGMIGACATNTLSSSRHAGAFVAFRMTNMGGAVEGMRGAPNDALGATSDGLPYVLNPAWRVVRW